MLFKVGKTSEGELVAYTDQERQKSILEAITERIDEIIGRWPESYGCNRIDEIHMGYEWTDLYRSDIDPTYHITSEQSRIMDIRLESCMEYFLEENNLNKETTYCDLTEEQKLSYSEYENEWFEPALLRVSISQYEIEISINYDDIPYYRPQYDEFILKHEIDETDKIDDIIKTLSKKYDEFRKEVKTS